MRYLKYITVAFIIVSFNACEDPIDVPIDIADALFTVDAWIDNRAQDQVITLSLSQNYFDSLTVQKLDEAEVVVSSNSGESYTFTSQGDGRYVYDATDRTLGIAGEQYTLDINHNGTNYSAFSSINRVPPIDSIEQEFREGEAFIDDGIYCNFFATDPAGSGDTYWIKTYKDERYLNRPSEINIAFDSTFDGGVAVESAQVFIQPIQEFNNEQDENRAPIPWLSGEVITVELHAISNEAFAFMELLRDQLVNGDNGIFAEPIANTPTNIVAANGAQVVGFFSVAAVSSLSDTIR